MAQSTTNYVIQGSTKGFTEAARAVASTNKLIQDSQAAQLKMARELAAALGMLKEKAQGTSKAINDVSGGGKSVPSGVSMTGTVNPGGGGKRSGKAGGDIGSILDALTKFGSGNGKQKIQELSTLFHKLRLDALGAAEAINMAGSAMGSMGGASVGGGAGGGSGGGGGKGPTMGPPPSAGGGTPFYGGRNGYRFGAGPGDVGLGAGGGNGMPGGGGGAFTQGLLEGILPNGLGRVLQRGPGVFAQAGGQMLGGLARTAMATPFNGAAGVSQLLGQVPVVGGALGALSSRAMSQVGSAVSQAQQTQSLNPYLGRSGRPFNDRMHLFISQDAEKSRATTNAYYQMANARRGTVEGTDIAQIGMLHGKDFSETQQFAAQMAAGSGRIYSTRRNRRSLNTALALGNLYGVSANTLGTYNRMAGQGLSGGGMGGAMSDVARAYGMGLRKPDIAQYLDANAAGEGQFAQTGFRPDPGQIGNLGSAFNGMGITDRRAENSARAVQGTVQGIGMNGPHGGLDLMLMQELGYDGGMRSGARVMRQMRSGNMGEQGGQAMARVLQKVARLSGGGDQGHLAALKAAQSYGMAANDKDIDNILANTGNTKFGLSGKLRKQLEANMQMDSEQTVDPITRRAKISQNQNLDIGTRMAESVQMFEKSVDNLTQGFSNTFTPALNTAAGALEYLTAAATPSGPNAVSSPREAQNQTSPAP
jgi:hypothetical protein